MPEVSVNTFLPVALATGSATFIGRLFFGTQPAFAVPAHLAALPNIQARADISAVRSARRHRRSGRGRCSSAALHLGRGPVRPHSRQLSAPRAGHASGRRADLSAAEAGRPLLRRGRGLRDDPGDPGWPALRRRLPGIAVRCKLFATSVSLGSGASGGIFSPSLFMGATLGAAFAGLIERCCRRAGQPAGLRHGRHGRHGRRRHRCSHDRGDHDLRDDARLRYRVADDRRRRPRLGVRRMLSAENIYTMKLVRRGHAMPKATARQHVPGAQRP